jgi:hypothetical protein
MFGIQKCGTILTVGINLVVCGAIVFYFHKRLLSLETAMQKQQQIFSAFVVEIRNKTQLAQTMVHPRFINQNGPMPSTTTTELASPEAIAAVSKLANTPQTANISQTNKIEVSDNESSSSEEEDESDDESVSDKEEEEEEKENIKKIKLSDFQETKLATKFEEMMVSSMSNNFMMMQGGGGEMLSGGIMIINGQPLMMNGQNEQMMMPCFVEITDLEEEETTKKVILLNDDSDSEFESDEEEEHEEQSRKSPVLLQIESLNEGDADEPVKIIKNTDFNALMKNSTMPLPKKTTKKNIVVMDMGLIADTNENEAVTNEADAGAAASAANKSENLKVDDLRKLASDKNLAAKEIIKKMKKPELLALLKQ